MRTKITKIQFFFTFFAIFCLFFCIFSFLAPNFSARAESSTYVVSANSAVVFSEPNLSSTKIATLSHKDEITLEMDGLEAKVYAGTGTSTDFQFFHLVDSGYVLCDLVSLSSNQIAQIPSFNAETNADAQVWEVVGTNFSQTNITLSKGTRIYLYEGFDESLAMTAISYVLDGEVCFGYILTSAVSPDGINSTIITCAIVIVALLGIIFAWLFIKNKKRKVIKEGKKALKEQKKQKKSEKKAKKQQKKLKNQNFDEIPTENG